MDEVTANAINAQQRGEIIGPAPYFPPRTRTGVKRSLFLINMSNPSDRIEVQNMPEKLDYDFKNKIIALASPGRNNPFYHYTGSEDSLDFTLTWYSAEENRMDVIQKCKWLESMSKNDGYSKKANLIGIDWHSITPYEPFQLFEFTTWIVVAAPVTFSLFHGQYNMLPTLATQKISLLKATKTNLTRKQVNDFRY